MWKVQEKFQSGDYQQVVELFYSSKSSKKKRFPHIASVVGALSFLGRMEEAEILASLHDKSCSKTDQMACRFFLAIGWVRRSEYSRAENLLNLNSEYSHRSSMERFFHHQGKAFYLFYTGRLLESQKEADLSRQAAMESKNTWARCLATDALGHVQVRAGAIQLGLSYLEEAKVLAKKIKNKSSESAIEISLQCYRWEYGWNQGDLADLQTVLVQQNPENSYSQASLLLEIGRQFTLRGNFSEAKKSLEKAAEKVYASKNRRQEILLHLRLSELAYRKGDLFQAKHYLWFSQRILHEEVDKYLELPVLGLLRKIALAEGNTEEVHRLEERWKQMHAYTSTRDLNLKVRLGLELGVASNPEDRIHEKLYTAEKFPTFEARLRYLLESGFYSEAARVIGLKPAEKTVALLPANLGIFVQTEGGLDWKTITGLQRKILHLLKKGCSKDQLLEEAWGYTYDPLRHDSMIYAAISGLRKSLGPAGSWVRPTEFGYLFEAELWVPEKQPSVFSDTNRSQKVMGSFQGNSSSTALVSPLVGATAKSSLRSSEGSQKFSFNHRQLEILDWLKSERFLSVKEVRDRFRVSEITALRDLDGLRKTGIVLRIGKARATRYAVAEENL